MELKSLLITEYKSNRQPCHESCFLIAMFQGNSTNLVYLAGLFFRTQVFLISQLLKQYIETNLYSICSNLRRLVELKETRVISYTAL